VTAAQRAQEGETLGLTIWHFVLHRDDSLQRYPDSRYQRFHGRELPLGVDVAAQANFIDVLLELDNRQPVRASRAWYPAYRLDDKGYWDVSHEEQALRDAVESLSSLAIRERTDNLYDIGPRVARARSQKVHRWHPAAKHLGQVCSAVNAKATMELLMHDGNELIPI